MDVVNAITADGFDEENTAAEKQKLKLSALNSQLIKLLRKILFPPQRQNRTRLPKK